MRYRNKKTGRLASKREWERSHGPKGKYVREKAQPRVSEEPSGPPPEPRPRRRQFDDDFDPFEIDLEPEEYGEVTL